MRWTWDSNKNRASKRKHGFSFETAQLVFGDPLAISRPEPFTNEERRQTVGVIARVTVFVVHTSPAPDPRRGEEVGRIVSARKATPHERKAYEEGRF